MKRALGLILLVCLPFLSGCAPLIDSDELRICRMVLPLLHSNGTAIDIASVNPVETSADTAVSAIRYDYLTKRPNMRYAAHFAVCLFSKTSSGQSRPHLKAIVTEHGHMSEASVLFIDRYFLDDPDSLASTPGPGTVELARLPHLPDRIAGALQHIFALLPMTGVYALLAASYALLYGLIGRINLAFGAFATLGGLGAALAIIGLQSLVFGGIGLEFGGFYWPLLLLVALAAATGLSASWGEALGALVLAPLVKLESEGRSLPGQPGAAQMQRSNHGQPILIASAGLLIALPEFMQLTQQRIWLKPILNTPAVVAAADHFLVTVTPISLIVFASSMLLSIGLILLMKYSRFGRSWRACADDALTAALFGVSPMRVLGVTITLACGLAGFAGFVFSLHYGSMGYSDSKVLGLKALVAAVAGGIGSLPGAILGGVSLGLLEALWSANLPIESRDVAIYCALVGLLALRPGGFFGFGDAVPRRV